MDRKPGWTPTEGQNRTLHIRYRRRAYAFVCALATLVFLISWLFRHPDDTFIAASYPMFSVIFAATGLALLRARVRLRLLELGLISLASVIIFTRLAWHFMVGDPLQGNLMALVTGHYWALALLIAGGFVTLGFRGGMAVGVISLAFSALLATGASLNCLQETPGECGNLLYLFRIHLFLVALLALISCSSLLHERSLSGLGDDVTSSNRD